MYIIGLILALIGLIISVITKNWVAAILWVLIMLQDYKILLLEQELEDLK